METPVTTIDLWKMFFGTDSPIFLLEIVIRTSIVYVYALLLLRWLGSRTIGQLSTVEFLLVIALGSAVGDAMFYPDVPLIHALLVVTIVVLANKGLDILIARSKHAEHALDGKPKEAIAGGVICKPFLRDTSLGVSELLQQLRHQGIDQLGQVAHAYVEADGVLTVFKAKQPKPGLRIVPPWEVEPLDMVPADRPAVEVAKLACTTCGFVIEPKASSAPGTCPHCQHEIWTPAQVADRFDD